MCWVGYSVSPNKHNKEEDLYVRGIEILYQICTDFEYNYWTCFYGGLYGLHNYQCPSWRYKNQYSQKQS